MEDQTADFGCDDSNHEQHRHSADFWAMMEEAYAGETEDYYLTDDEYWRKVEDDRGN